MKKYWYTVLLNEDLSTYDPYDIWKTKIGFSIKNLYNTNKYLGLLPSAFITVVDLFFNKFLRFFYQKQEYPIVRAQAALILLNLFASKKDSKFLHYAKTHIDWLITNSCSGFHGLCWGLNFNWPAGKGLIYDKNEPFTTHTPYVLEAIDRYIEMTGDIAYIKHIESIFNYYEHDVKIMKETPQILAVSYGTSKDRLITNAVSYTLFAYTIFYKYFGDTSILRKREKLFNFIKSKQLDNGSWMYTPDSEDTFIDCFHSCFVLKNLIKSNENFPIDGSENIILNGYNYIMDNFYDQRYGLFRRFVISNKPSIIKFDLYDNAEMLNLFSLLGKKLEFKDLNEKVIKFFVKKNNIYSVIDKINFKRNKNTLRWAVIPYLNAIS